MVLEVGCTVWEGTVQKMEVYSRRSELAIVLDETSKTHLEDVLASDSSSRSSPCTTFEILNADVGRS